MDYIIKNSYGCIYQFYYENETIFFKNINHGSSSSNNNSSVIKDVHNDFFVTIDKKDNLHLICQNKKGDVLYLYCSDETTWNKQVILYSKKISFYDKYFFLIPCDNIIHFFYVIKNDDKNLLTNQTMYNNTINEPVVIDYININSKVFSADKDSNENIFIFYSPASNNSEFGYKKFNYLNLKWSNYTTINKNEYNSIPNILIDSCDNIHLVWLCYKNNTTNIMYKKILPHDGPNNRFVRGVIINSKNANFTTPFLTIIDENLWAIWQDNKNTYICLSSDNHFYWNKPIKYKNNYFENLKPVFYATNFPNEKDRVLVKFTLANTQNYLYIILISELLEISKDYIEETAVTAENVKNLDSVDLYFENIKSYFFKIVDKIDSLQKENSELQEQINELTAENSKLFYEKNSLKENIQNLNLENKEYDVEIKNLNKKINNITDLLNQKNCEIDDYINEIKNLQQKNADLNNQLFDVMQKNYEAKNSSHLRKFFKSILSKFNNVFL